MQDCLQKDSICKASRLTQFLSLIPVIAPLLWFLICLICLFLRLSSPTQTFVLSVKLSSLRECTESEETSWSSPLIASSCFFSFQWGVTSVGQCTATCVLHYSIFHHWQQNILILYDKKIGWSLAATNIFFIFHFYILNRCPRIKQNPRL